VERRVDDDVVVGGGIIGSATACCLARRGVGVVLVERNEIAGGSRGATGCASGSRGDPAEVPLVIESNRIGAVSSRADG
jgi:glycine/D-amino acid oxidase-like deaminating enzyme